MFACGIGQLVLATGIGMSAGIQQALIPFLPGVAFKSAVLFALGAGLLAHRRSSPRPD
jgi:biotin transporter BioY